MLENMAMKRAGKSQSLADFRTVTCISSRASTLREAAVERWAACPADEHLCKKSLTEIPETDTTTQQLYIVGIQHMEKNLMATVA